MITMTSNTTPARTGSSSSSTGQVASFICDQLRWQHNRQVAAHGSEQRAHFATMHDYQVDDDEEDDDDDDNEASGEQLYAGKRSGNSKRHKPDVNENTRRKRSSHGLPTEMMATNAAKTPAAALAAATASRLSINARERRRMHDLNDALDDLRSVRLVCQRSFVARRKARACGQL